MSSKPDLWMPLYFGDYLSDTMHLTAEQHGAYLLLLFALWKRGGVLPNDDAQLGAITKLTPARWKIARAVLAPFLIIAGNTISQKRLTRELAAARGRSDTASKNGSLGGRPRKANENPDDNLNETETESGTKAKHNPRESSSQSQSPTSLPSSPSSPAPSPSQKAGSRALARATRLPSDWTLPREWGEWAMQERKDLPAGRIRAIAQEFRDHWIAAPGQRGVKADWEATWRNWVRREKRSNGNGRGTLAERNDQAAREWLESSAPAIEHEPAELPHEA